MRPDRADIRTLRYVALGDTGYVLHLWDTFQHMGNYSRLGYAFFRRGESPLFMGEDFGCSHYAAIDSDKTLKSLLGFLFLRVGDTGSEYFSAYTPEQRSFAESEAEFFQLWLDEVFDIRDES